VTNSPFSSFLLFIQLLILSYSRRIPRPPRTKRKFGGPSICRFNLPVFFPLNLFLLVCSLSLSRLLLFDTCFSVCDGELTLFRQHPFPLSGLHLVSFAKQCCAYLQSEHLPNDGLCAFLLRGAPFRQEDFALLFIGFLFRSWCFAAV